MTSQWSLDILHRIEFPMESNFNSNLLPEKIDSVEYAPVAHSILKSMNTTTDPCDNFFQYACGRWIQEHPMPDDKSGYGTEIGSGREVTDCSNRFERGREEVCLNEYSFDR
ncbi:unnamed protein product [Litomosoides sigmodontis]|uniref:Peptidase M13 N-terminal domain-containing protein n=1 Tax=Litomosoides sigmodontis TaxID=42156 RepID=A0A3P7JL76_LITSI|nr:unnamed protein product [Litomosoides sigmodontis]